MPIVSVNETFSGRRGDITLPTEPGSAEDVLYVKMFTVITSDPGDGSFTVADAEEIPKIGDDVYIEYAIIPDPEWVFSPQTPIQPNIAVKTFTDDKAICRAVIPQQRPDDPYTWDVRVEYVNGLFKDPLLEPPEIEISFSQFQIALIQDRSNPPKTILNSAGDPYDPPVQVDSSRITVRVTRNERLCPYLKAQQYKDRTNSDNFQGSGAGFWKVTSIGGVLNNGPDWKRPFWKVTYVLDYRDDGWQLSLLDAGFHHLNAGVKICNLNPQGGQPFSSPQLLDGAGGLLIAGRDPVYLTYTGYKPLPFAPLNLPSLLN